MSYNLYGFRLEKMHDSSSNSHTVVQNQCKLMTETILLLQNFFFKITMEVNILTMNFGILIPLSEFPIKPIQ